MRAGIVTVEGLSTYRQSSYWYLGQPKRRPAFLSCETALVEAGVLPDNPAGRRSYQDYLSWQAMDGPVGKSKAYVSMSKGWALGGKDFKQALLQDHAVATEARAWESAGVREIREAQRQRVLDHLRQKVPAQDLADRRKSAPWKVKLAMEMKAATEAANGWLAEQLDMGSGFYLSKHVGLTRRKVKGKAT